jgi:hypothetical protein
MLFNAWPGIRHAALLRPGGNVVAGSRSPTAVSPDAASLDGVGVVVACAASRSRTVFRIVESDPTLLLFRGKMLREAIKAARSSEDKVLHAIHAAGDEGMLREASEELARAKSALLSLVYGSAQQNGAASIGAPFVSHRFILAEGEGFEPPRGLRPGGFQVHCLTS